MVIFILAAAAAFLLSGAFAPQPLSNWLEKKSRALRLFLFLFLLAAALLILVADTASPHEVSVILLGLAIFSLISAMANLMYRLPAQVRPTPVEGLTGTAGLSRAGESGLSTSGQSTQRPAAESPRKTRLFGVLRNDAFRSRLLVLLVLRGLAVVAFLGSVVLFVFPLDFYWFKRVAISLATCTWVLVASLHVLLMRSSHPEFKWLRKRTRQTRLVRCSLLFTALLSTFIAWNGDAWAYAMLLAIRRITSTPESIHALLGVVAGLMCGNFHGWITYAADLGIGKTEKPSKSQRAGAAQAAVGPTETEGASPTPAPASASGGDDRPRIPRQAENGQPPEPIDSGAGTAASGIWPITIFAIALSGVLLVALAAPYEQSVLSRVSGFETPYLKVQFVTSPAEKQRVLNTERDLSNRDSLDSIPRSRRFIQYDCAQEALDADMSIDEFRPIHSEFDKGIVFRRRLIPYINQLVAAQRKDDYSDNPAVKVRAGRVAEKFAVLAMKGSDFANNYSEAMREVEEQEKSFGFEGVDIRYPREEVDRQSKDKDSDPLYCLPPGAGAALTPPKPYIDRPDTADVRMVLERRPRLVLSFAAALFSFEGNVDAASAVFKGIYKLDPKTKDTNVIGSFADSLYIAGDDLREALAIQEADLRLTERRLRQAEAETVWGRKGPDEAKALGDLVKRYKRARFIIRLRLAYMWAQHDLAPEEDLLPQRDLHWSNAQKYADDAYEAVLDRSKSPPRFACTDDDWDLRIKDTYAFVKLAYQAYNLKTQRRRPDDFQVRQAREILEDALAEAREERRRSEEARSPTGAARGVLSCFSELETRAWVKRISNHLKLADALQP